MRDDYIVISSRQLRGFATHERDVLMEVELAQASAEVVGSAGFLLRMSASEAREVARMLVRKADEAEAGLPRA